VNRRRRLTPLPYLRKALIYIYEMEIERVTVGADDDPTRFANLHAKLCTCCLLAGGQPSALIHKFRDRFPEYVDLGVRLLGNFCEHGRDGGLKTPAGCDCP
jgi:hypothetical protein